MNLVLKVALRNLLRHKGKTIVIGSILFIGAVMMVLGNATIAAMRKGFQESFVNNFMGDITIISTNQEVGDVIQGMPRPMKVISVYTNLRETLNGLDYVDKFVPLGKGGLMMLNENGDPYFTLAFGVDLEKYLSMFNTNITIKEGRMLNPGERGMLLNSSYRDLIYHSIDVWYVTKSDGLVESNLSPEALSNRDTLRTEDEPVMMGMSADLTGGDVRIPIIGMFNFKALDTALNEINFVDIESFRECAGYFTAQDTQVVVSEENADLLNADTENLDDLFSSGSGDSMFESIGYEEVTRIEIQQTVETAEVDPDLGAYNLVFVKLKRGVDRHEAVEMMNALFKEKQLDAQAMPWDVAAGSIAKMMDIAGIVMNVGIIMIFFVAIIIIINTLNMAAMERSSEIGMMRAVGAQKSFIAKMFAVETTVISFLFGGTGIIIGAILVLILDGANITASSRMDFMTMLFGGDKYQPLLSVGTIILGILELGVVTVLSMLFPIRLAKKITPLDAISRE